MRKNIRLEPGRYGQKHIYVDDKLVGSVMYHPQMCQWLAGGGPDDEMLPPFHRESLAIDAVVRKWGDDA